jgi:hypothetical protein
MSESYSDQNCQECPHLKQMYSKWLLAGVHDISQDNGGALCRTTVADHDMTMVLFRSDKAQLKKWM